MSDRAAIVWRWPAVRVLLAIVPLWPTLAVLVFGAPLALKVPVAAMLIASLASPYHALLAVAGFVPLADYAGILLDLGSFRLGEAVTVAFLTGWLLRGEPARRGPRLAAIPGWTLAAILVASMVITAARSTDGLWSTLRWAYYGYYLNADPSGWVDGARILEGVALVAAVFATVRRRPQAAVTLPAALAISVVAAGLTSILLWFQIAPAVVLQRHKLIGYRYTAHTADVNAAGSYFVLCICVALGMALRSTSHKRFLWLIAAASGGAAAWLAGSRAASAAAVVALGGAAVWWVAADWSHRAKLAVASATAVIVLAAGIYQFRELTRDREYRSADFRQQFNAASLRMIRAAPASGVGIGQYRPASVLFLGPAVSYSYGSENAHDYFLQLAAELGLIGFAVFAWWMAAGFVTSIRAASYAPRDTRLLGLIAGSGSFVATWATGHPLLLHEVAVPFWIAFGLMWALAAATLIDGIPNRVWQGARAIAVAAFVLFVAAYVGTNDATLRPPESRDVTGLFEWEVETNGGRYRWTGEYGSLFVPSDVTRVYIPVRAPAVAPSISPMQVEARTVGRPGLRTTVGDGWMTINLPLPDAVPNGRFKRINLRAEHTWQPALYVPGSTDMRELGVQIGEVQLFRER